MISRTVAARPWWPEFRQGMRDAGVILLGYFPLGLSYGMFAVALGLDWWWATIAAAAIYAGSIEFLVAQMLVVAAPLTTAATTALFVNVRHIFYGLSVPMERIRNPLIRAYTIHTLTDEVYAVLSSQPRDEVTPARMFGAGLISHFYWVFSSTVGAVCASFMPFDLSFMGFAMTALFVVLAMDALRRSREFGLFVAALAIGIAALFLARDVMLITALVSYAVLAFVVASVRRRRADAAAAEVRA